ncbi:MAG TPA: hypothetical protein VGI40_13525 [Pirellulaceae bacterium]|jgi:hypothetical protein
MPTEPNPLAAELIRAVELLSETFADRSIRYAIVGGLATMMRGVANRPEIDVNLIRHEWQPYAETEASRTAWLESAIARLLP